MSFTSMTDTPIQPDDDKARQSPGELLKQAREKLGLALTDIASQLNLQPDVIDAVEKNDKTRLPVATYFRGYIRSYARLVKLDGDMLIKLYDHESAPPPEIVPNIKQPTQTSSRDKPVVAVTYLITFIMALLLLAWLMGKYSGNNTPYTAESGDKTSQPAALPEKQTPEVNAAPATPEIEQTLEGNAPDYTPYAQDTAQSQAPGNTVNETATVTPPAVVAALPAPINPALAPDNAMQGKDRLEFIVNHDSWIEAYDANNTRMYHGFAQAGKQLKLSGAAPFSVLLGYAPGVTVKFNDKPFDPTPYSKAGLARFTLDAKTNQ